jgi:hypothetical protein
MVIDFFSQVDGAAAIPTPLSLATYQATHGHLGPDTENAFIFSIWHDDQSLKGYRSLKRLLTTPMPEPRVSLRVIPQWRCCRAIPNCCRG